MRTGISYAALIAALSAAVGMAQAQTEPAGAAVELEEVTLSGSGTPVALSRTGALVTVLTETDLKRDGAAALASQLARLPGLSMSRNGGMGTSTALRIRGLGPAYIGVRIDGIDVSDPSGTQCSYDFGSTTSANLSRVEVLRGSQSALFGSEAIGGLVDITTFRASQEGIETQVSLEGGSANSSTATASVGLKKDRLELAFSANRTATDGISAYAGGTEKDASKSRMLTFYGAYELAPGVRLGLNGFSRNSYAEFDSQTADNAETEHGRLRGTRFFLEAAAGNFRHELAFARTTTSRTYPLGWVKAYDGTRRQLSWKGSYADAGPVSFNWGLDQTKETFSAGSDRGGVTTKAVYGEALWAATPDLDLSFALRRDDHETFGGETSGRIAAAWRADDKWILRAVASTGFRAPSLYELYSAYGNRALQPETSRSFELGAEYRFDAANSIQVTLFDTEIDNKINFGRRSYEQVPGTTRTRGLEITGSHRLSAAWTVFGNYTWTDAWAEAAGLRTEAVRVPRHDLALGIEGQLSERLSARLALHHVADFSDTGIYPAPASKMPDYTVVNAALSYQVNDSTQAWLRVENLFDEDYQMVRNYGQPGRQIFLGVSTRF